MSEIDAPATADRLTEGVDTARRPCRRMIPDTYRCSCGRVRDRCVRASVRALWSAAALRPARSART